VLPSLSTKGLSRLLTALTRLRHRPAWGELDQIVVRVRELFVGSPPSELVTVVAALVRLPYIPPGDFWDDLLECIRWVDCQEEKAVQPLAEESDGSCTHLRCCTLESIHS
jgi:hypothetical protein